MTFIPISTQLLHAMSSDNAIKVEELILNSDSKSKLILEYVSQNGDETLKNLLPQFKSKGLVLTIKNLLDIE
ncbi:MAG: hypothetical protein R2837_01970 [Aliarcobacter sp.]